MKSTILILSLLISFVCLIPMPLYAYIGPGAGLSAIGAFIAIIAAIFVAIFGFIWYPLKRFWKKHKKNSENENEDGAE